MEKIEKNKDARGNIFADMLDNFELFVGRKYSEPYLSEHWTAIEKDIVMFCGGCDYYETFKHLSEMFFITKVDNREFHWAAERSGQYIEITMATEININK